MCNSEYTQKRQQILCYKYDEKFSHNHRCKNRQLNLLIISEAPNTDEDDNKEFFRSTGEYIVEGNYDDVEYTIIDLQFSDFHHETRRLL